MPDIIPFAPFYDLRESIKGVVQSSLPDANKVEALMDIVFEWQQQQKP